MNDGDAVSPRFFIQTFTGKRFYWDAIESNEIAIEDIAHATAASCRFTGHTKRFYSVAEHCVHVSHLVPAEDALWGLLHDGPEAYTNDLNRPLKHFTAVGPTYREVESGVMDAVCTKFGLPQSQPRTVTDADNSMLYVEKDALLWPIAWETKWGTPAKHVTINIRCWSPEVAKTMFLSRFYQLTGRV